MDDDANVEYIVTCGSMRKVKWDSNGVDDISTSRYCASCGGDWWRGTYEASVKLLEPDSQFSVM